MADDEAVTQAAADSVTTQKKLGPRKKRWKRRVTIVSGLTVLIAAAVVLPPLINIGRYQKQVTALMSRSLGRPVRLSSVELRLLPRPGFVLRDLSVGEDPAFGAEPVLSARTVVASVGIFPLWRGRLEVNRISVDEASLNLVRSAQAGSGQALSGQSRWNLESLMMGSPSAAGLGTGAARQRFGKAVPFPYLEATNSRVNLKNGAEKTPFSLIGTDLSLWQDEPGAWRVRLRGQPVRTDMEMSAADTGEVRVEASLRMATPAKQLRAVPLTLQMEWREAQLGQLSRLLTGSDAGWRGDLTADVNVQGTLDSAQTRTRLRATGVRREEFAPETPLDFDANCNFRYEHLKNALHDLNCNTAIGDGLLHLKADLPGPSGQPQAMLEVKQIPLQAGLDLLRTVRSGFAPGITARGSASGSLTLEQAGDKLKQDGARPTLPYRTVGSRRSKRDASVEARSLGLQGTIVVEGAMLKGGALKESLVLPRTTWTPVAIQSPALNGIQVIGLSSQFTIPLAASRAQESSLTINPASSTATHSAQGLGVRLIVNSRGYDAAVSGSAGSAQLRELAYAFGVPHLDAVDGFTGGTADVDLRASGSWLSPDTEVPAQISTKSSVSTSGTLTAEPSAPIISESDGLIGTIQLKHAEWKADYLARAVELPQATVMLSPGLVAMTSEFIFGAVKGSLAVNAPTQCRSLDCVPQVQLRFAALDAAALQGALLGAPAEKTLLSPLIERIRSSPDRPAWPEAKVSVQADTLLLGPVLLHKPQAQLTFDGNRILFESWEATVLGGSASGRGEFAWQGAKPEFTFEGDFTRLSANSIGALLGTEWSGSPVSGHGNVKLSGFTDKELSASAAGTLDFKWDGGTITNATVAGESVHFEDWSGTVSILGGKAQLGENKLVSGKHLTAATGSLVFGGPVKITLEPAIVRHKRQERQTPPEPGPDPRPEPSPAAPPVE